MRFLYETLGHDTPKLAYISEKRRFSFFKRVVFACQISLIFTVSSEPYILLREGAFFCILPF